MQRACSLVMKVPENNFVEPPTPTLSERNRAPQGGWRRPGDPYDPWFTCDLTQPLDTPRPRQNTQCCKGFIINRRGAGGSWAPPSCSLLGQDWGRRRQAHSRGIYLTDDCLVSSVVKPKWISCLCPGSRSFFRSHWLQPFCIKILLVFPIII